MWIFLSLLVLCGTLVSIVFTVVVIGGNKVFGNPKMARTELDALRSGIADLTHEIVAMRETLADIVLEQAKQLTLPESPNRPTLVRTTVANDNPVIR